MRMLDPAGPTAVRIATAIVIETGADRGHRVIETTGAPSATIVLAGPGRRAIAVIGRLTALGRNPAK